VLDARPGDGVPGEALSRRAWDSYLLALDDAQLAAVEIAGLSAEFGAAPSSFVAMVEDTRAVCALESFAVTPVDRSLRRREKPRKRAQVQAFSEVLLPLSARAKRVVDIGSGHGHLTRDVASRIAMPVIGLERNNALATRARALSTTTTPSFAVTDVLDDGLAISDGDCVIGLHACGELGDAMVERCAAHAASIVLVGCCLQKRRAEARRPLCDAPDALTLPRALLGLSNLTPGDVGVEATREDNLAARERRLALHQLLSTRLGPLRFGAEIDGLNRRAAHLELASLVERAFAHRALPLPSAAEIAAAAEWARTQHARARRLSIPRALLARALEVFVLLDRARYLEQRGFTVEIGALFPPEVSARNLALVARR